MTTITKSDPWLTAQHKGRHIFQGTDTVMILMTGNTAQMARSVKHHITGNLHGRPDIIRVDESLCISSPAGTLVMALHANQRNILIKN